jgi:hypothetical protein
VKTPPESVALFGDRKPAVVMFTKGSGRVVAVAIPAIWENARLREAENARFFAQLVASEVAPVINGATPKEHVYFDEFHQGYTNQQSFWSLIGPSGQWAVYQIIAVALLAVYSASRRFGLPRPLPPPSRVSSEYVQSLADLYRRSRATDAALEGVYLSFWRDLCRVSGMPLDAPPGEVATRASAALADNIQDRPALARRLESVLTRCEERIAGGPKALTDTELLQLAREISDLRKDTVLGTDDSKR